MISLFSIFLQQCLAEILIQNLVNTTQGIQSTPLNNFCENLLPQNNLKISVTQQSSEMPILAICQDKLENIENFEDLLDSTNDRSNSCLLDYNAYVLKNKTQIIFLSHNQYPTLVSKYYKIFQIEGNKCNAIIYSTTDSEYILTIESFEIDECAEDCKNKGVCVKGFCQCPIGFVGYDCSIAATNIEYNNYFYGFQVQYLDLITLQSVDYTIELNSDISYSIQCYSNSSRLFMPHQIGKTLKIEEDQINLCKEQTLILEQFTKISYYSQFIVVTNTSDVVQYSEYNTEQPQILIVVIVLVTILSLIIIFIIVVYILKKKSSVKQQNNVNQIQYFMPVQQFLSVTDRKSSQKDEQFCSICLELFKPDSNVRITYCEHIFHVNCLQNWMRKNKICPLCRASLDTITIQSKRQDLKSPQKTHILQQLGQQQKNDGSLTSIDGSLTFHSPVTKQLGVAKHSKFLK
ncbi:unnamed protein product (macronuclear) [Paramecium tetraurelia]|uniref:RING-type domain-containing protein n=1 Tax=Paramecium tetraurelia TaxID=5888 RepID=A0CEZ8_PARTE|nr:uncharacterized protein GSPATT00037804001 [Paramecium tetraurelia]CAK69365.1 unnamed protein product [Paramecium tetraurelia]|eukprot:XP_001436762.1 hypothetical protein (macronuclear) [Paramecium tetraurelia strain d4-2]